MAGLNMGGAVAGGAGIELDYVPDRLRVALNSSMSVTYNLILTSLSNTSISDAAHDATIKLVEADYVADGDRTGNLAKITRDNLGEDIFKDEYVDTDDFALRGLPLIGSGSHDVRYVRPEVTYALGGAPTVVSSYGDGSGKTYGDAYAGPKDYAVAKAGLTSLLRLYIVGEQLITQDQISGGRTITTVGDIVVDQDGTSDAVRTEVRGDYPKIKVHNTTLDRGVFYGGLMLIDTGQSWSSDIVAMAYTETVALVSSDKGKPIVLTVDGDTGTVLDYDASTIWIGTDGAVGNDFSESGGAFTITGGTGTGTQDSAATAVSNIWWWASAPTIIAGAGPLSRDPGSAFGNAVDVYGYEPKTGMVGTAFEHTLSVQTAPGLVPLTRQDTIAQCISTEDTSYYASGANNQFKVVHIVNGEDPTNRIMSPSYGVNVSFGGEAQSNLLVTGFRGRFTGLGAGPTDNWTVDDFSIRYANAGIGYDPDDWSVDHSNYRFTNGCIIDAGNGIYPAKAANQVRTCDGNLVERVYFERIGGGFYPAGDNHNVGSQGALKNWTIRKCICGPDTGNFTLYQWAGITTTGIRDWGTVLIEQNDFQDGPMDDWNGKGSNSADSAIHLSGDNDDDAYLGNAKATPDTTKWDTSDVTIQNNKIRGDWLQPIRTKWKDNKILITDNDTDTTATGGVDISLEGVDTNWNNVVRVPVSTTTPLVDADAGRVITMDTDGDTGTIVDFDANDILVRTDGTAGNSFDNSPTSNGAFTITGGTGAGSQSAVGVAEPNRAPRVRVRNHTFGANSDAFFDINVNDATDYVVDSDNNTYPAAESAAMFIVSGSGTITGTAWKAKSRAGNGFNAEASVFDPSSTFS